MIQAGSLVQIHIGHRRKTLPQLILAECPVILLVLWGVATRPFFIYLPHKSNLWDSFSFYSSFWWGMRIFALPKSSQYSCRLYNWLATTCDQLRNNRVPTTDVVLSSVPFVLRLSCETRDVISCYLYYSCFYCPCK